MVVRVGREHGVTFGAYGGIEDGGLTLPLAQR